MFMFFTWGCDTNAQQRSSNFKLNEIYFAKGNYIHFYPQQISRRETRPRKQVADINEQIKYVSVNGKHSIVVLIHTESCVWGLCFCFWWKLVDSQKSNEGWKSVFRNMQFREPPPMEMMLFSALRGKSTVLRCHTEGLCNQGNKQQAKKMVRLTGEVWSEGRIFLQ